MSQKVLETDEDLQWLLDTHLVNKPEFFYTLVLLEGNEDSPKSLTFVEQDHYLSLSCKVLPNEDGKFFPPKKPW